MGRALATPILHPGAPKTATTTLQYILRENRRALQEKGIGLILPEDIRGKPFLGAYLAAYRGKHIPQLPRLTAEFFAPYLSKFQTVICSEETFCHDFMPSLRLGAGGIDKAHLTAAILSQSGADKTRVVLTIRPQMDFLISTYTHFVHRQGELRSFPDWIDAEVRLKKMRWAPAVAAFRHRFGSDAVDVVSMAQHDRIEGFLSAVLDRLGVGELPIAMPSGDRMNPSPSAEAVQKCRAINAVILSNALSETVNSQLVEDYPAEEHGKFYPHLWVKPMGLDYEFASDHDAALLPPQTA